MKSRLYISSQQLKNIKTQIKHYPKFYQQVWLACLQIPPGEIRTYKWIAEKISHPKAYRCVGRALNSNPLAPVIPCHRVIRSNGTLGGYKYGIKKKISLLTKEGWKRLFFVLLFAIMLFKW